MAKMESDLRIEAQRHQIQFSTLHVERAEKIQEVYQGLCDAQRAIERHNETEFGNSEGELRVSEDLYLTANEIILGEEEKFERSKLYFRKEFCDALEGFFKRLKMQNSAQHVEATSLAAVGEEYPKLLKKNSSHIDQMKMVIEEEFRKLIGTIEGDLLGGSE